MPETGDSNIDVAHHLSEHKVFSHSHRKDTVEIAEALLLAIVAVTSAWSGYQAAIWSGHQAERYGEASRLRIQADGIANTANEERVYIAATVVEWIKAEINGEKKLAAFFERRILPDFRPAFEAWKKTDPINNRSAPAGPQLMAEYRNSKTEEAARLNDEAATVFEEGNKARHLSDDYVRVTVILATILLLTAISQRFKGQRVRVAMMVLAVLLLCRPIYIILRLPRELSALAYHRQSK